MVNLGWLLPEAFLGGGDGRCAPTSPARRSRRARRRRSACRSRRRRWAPCRSSRTRWCSRSRRTPCARATTRATSRSSPRAARARCSLRRSRSRSGRRGCSCRRYPGVTAAHGPARDRHGLRVRLDRLPAALEARRAPRSQSRFEELEEQARAQLEEDGVPADRLVIQRVADCRYLGQGYELRVDAPSGAIDDGWVEKVRADFHDIHEREYSRRFEESDIEIPNVRVRGIGLMPPLATPEVEHGRRVARRGAAPRGRGVVPGRRRAASRSRRATTTAPRCKAGNRLEGPAIVNQYDSTTVIPPGLAAHVDRFGNIVIDDRRVRRGGRLAPHGRWR